MLRGKASLGMAGSSAPHGYGRASVSKGFIMPEGVDALLKAVTSSPDTTSPPHKEQRAKASSVWATSEGMLGAAAPGVLVQPEPGSVALSRSGLGSGSGVGLGLGLALALTLTLTQN